MDWFRAIADSVALFILLVQLPIPLFWLFIHPVIDFWRRHPRACYTVVGFGAWGLTATALLGWRHWWLAERFAQHPLLALAGAGLAPSRCRWRRAASTGACATRATWG